MLIFKYLFYKVYSIYAKRWPRHSPEEYGHYAVCIITIFWILGILFNLSSPLKNGPSQTSNIMVKVIGICAAVGIYLFFYMQFLYKDRYIVFCKPEYFEKTILKNKRVANLTMWFFILIPFMLIILAMIIK